MDQEKWVVSIGIHDIDALISQKKHLNPTFCRASNFILKKGMNFVHGKNLGFFHDKQGQMGS